MYVCNVLAYLGLYLYARMGQVVSLVALLRAWEKILPSFSQFIHLRRLGVFPSKRFPIDMASLPGNYRMLGSRLTTAFHALLALRVRWQQRYSCAKVAPLGPAGHHTLKGVCPQIRNCGKVCESGFARPADWSAHCGLELQNFRPCLLPRQLLLYCNWY